MAFLPGSAFEVLSVIRDLTGEPEPKAERDDPERSTLAFVIIQASVEEAIPDQERALDVAERVGVEICFHSLKAPLPEPHLFWMHLLMRPMWREAPEDAGYAVLEAGDEEEGVARFQQRPADLVITDLVMPRKGGIALAKEIRGMCPSVPIIAITGGSREGNPPSPALCQPLTG